MIYKYSRENLSRWVSGDLQCQLDVPGKRIPMGWCDGTEEDEQELRMIAESEEVDNLVIEKKLLKTGREIWTVGAPPSEEGFQDYELD